MAKGLIYQVTNAGQRAWENPRVPLDYRRLLRFIAPEAHADVIRSHLRRYSDRLILEWLAELEELNFLKSKPDTVTHDLDFTTGIRLPELLEEDRKQLAEDAKAARESLSRQGVYLSADRIAHRAASRKPAAETVVLIVEDDPDQLALAKFRVTLAGYAVRAADSASALRFALLGGEVPDLLLLDVGLPDGDGFEILAKLRSNPGFALLPVVMLTVKDAQADIQKGLALGADGYMTKPYSKASLAQVLRQVLGQVPA